MSLRFTQSDLCRKFVPNRNAFYFDCSSLCLRLEKRNIRSQKIGISNETHLLPAVEYWSEHRIGFSFQHETLVEIRWTAHLRFVDICQIIVELNFYWSRALTWCHGDVRSMPSSSSQKPNLSLETQYASIVVTPTDQRASRQYSQYPLSAHGPSAAPLSSGAFQDVHRDNETARWRKKTRFGTPYASHWRYRRRRTKSAKTIFHNLSVSEAKPRVFLLLFFSFLFRIDVSFVDTLFNSRINCKQTKKQERKINIVHIHWPGDMPHSVKS